MNILAIILMATIVLCVVQTFFFYTSNKGALIALQSNNIFRQELSDLIKDYENKKVELNKEYQHAVELLKQEKQDLIDSKISYSVTMPKKKVKSKK